MAQEPGDLDDWKKLPSRNIEEASEPIMARMIRAIKEGEKIRITYLKGSDPGSSREITPQRVFERQDFYYVEAHCHTRGERRCFRTDRIRIAGIGARKPARKYDVSSEPRQYTQPETTSRQPVGTPSNQPSNSHTTQTASSSSGSGGSGCLVILFMVPAGLGAVSLVLHLIGAV